MTDWNFDIRLDQSWLPNPTFEGVTYTTRATIQCPQAEDSSISFHSPGGPRTALVTDGPIMSLESGAYFASRVGIGTTTPQATLHVNGDILASGDIAIRNADCAEEFAVADKNACDAGTVMVLGEDGLLRESTEPYDRKVAGVISGAGTYKPGLILDRQDESNRIAIAMLGKVFCKVDADSAPVGIGDLLTTSATPGHSMKATDPTRAFGTVIGKALKPLSEGRGLIPILVAMQ